MFRPGTRHISGSPGAVIAGTGLVPDQWMLRGAEHFGVQLSGWLRFDLEHSTMAVKSESMRRQQIMRPRAYHLAVPICVYDCE